MKKITLLFFVFVINTITAQSLVGTWKMSPQAGALGVGPGLGDTSWWSNGIGDVTTRACYFDDEFIFNSNGTFTQTFGTQTWLETWQGVAADGCGTPIAPHNGSNAATWSVNTVDNTITISGTGAFLGLSKVCNGSELSPTNTAVPASRTYKITSITSALVTLDISIGAGWWRFVLAKQGVTPTCTDGIQNGDETGVDCGGSCTACLTQIDLPVTFEGTTTDYTVVDFGGNASTKVADPENPANTVIKSIKTAGAETWAGTTIGTPLGFTTAIPFATSSTKMYVRVHSAEAGIPVRLKVENPTNATQSVETQTNTTTTGWQTLEFDFANQAPGTAALNIAYPFKKASIFFNFGTSGATAGEKTFYFDNVSFASPLSLYDADFNNAFSLYPNPATTTLNIETLEKVTSLAIYNLLGQVILEKSIQNDVKNIDIASLNSGTYFVKIVTDSKQVMKKFIKK